VAAGTSAPETSEVMDIRGDLSDGKGREAGR
jgi:hypothetical protein